jgi:hypothetical protein
MVREQRAFDIQTLLQVERPERVENIVESVAEVVIRLWSPMGGVSGAVQNRTLSDQSRLSASDPRRRRDLTF